MDKFLKHLLPLFGRHEPAPGCPEDGVCWAFAAGEPLPAASRRSVQRHVLRCPACMEKVLVLRRLAGNTAPLIRSRVELFPIGAAWRPLASVAAMLVLAVGLYLGGSSLFRVSQVRAPALPEMKPAAPVEMSPVPLPASAAPAGRTDSPAAPANPPLTGKPAPQEQENKIAARSEVFAPEPAGMPAPAVVAREKGGPEGRAESLSDYASEGVDSAKNESLPQRAETAKEEARTTPAPPAAVGEEGAAGAVPKLSVAASAEVKSRTGAGGKDKRARDEESEHLPDVRRLCRGLRTDTPTLTVRQRVFYRIDGYLVERGLCDAPDRPCRPATDEELDHFLRTAVLPDDCPGVFLSLPGQIVYFPLRPR